MNCLDLFDLSIEQFLGRFRKKAGQLVVFQHVPKTAGSSIHAELNRLPLRGFHWMESTEEHCWSDFHCEHAVQPFQILRGHLRKQHLDELMDRDIPFLGITFLRHPIQQIVSHYRYCHSEKSARYAYHRKEHADLETFLVKYLKENFSTRFLVGECDTADEAIDKISRRFTLVGLTEYFNTGMYLLMHCLGAKYQVQPRKNVTESDDSICELLTDSVFEIIDRDYAIDMAVHRFFMQRYGEVAERVVEHMSSEQREPVG